MAENISTINKTGEDYNTLTLWEAAKQGDLVAAGNIETAECYDDDGDLSESVAIAGSTTNSSNYLKITVASGDRHDGTASGGGFLLDATGTNSHGIRVENNYTRIHWVRIKGFGDGSFGAFSGIHLGLATGARVSHCICHDENSGNSGQAFNIGNDNDPTDIIIWNCIGYGCNRAFRQRSDDTSALNNYLYNCTGYGGTETYDIDFGSHWTAINCIAFGASTGNDFGSIAWESGSDYNLSEDDSAPGANSIHTVTDGANVDFVSTTGGSEDFHLDVDSDAIDAGTSSVSGTVTDDIDGDTRTGSYDIGADETTGGGGPTTSVGQMTTNTGYWGGVEV